MTIPTGVGTIIPRGGGHCNVFQLYLKMCNDTMGKSKSFHGANHVFLNTHFKVNSNCLKLTLV